MESLRCPNDKLNRLISSAHVLKDPHVRYKDS